MKIISTTKKLALFVAFALTAALGIGAAQAATVQRYQQAAFQAAQKNDEPILVFVEASWCPICAKERPILQQLYATPEFANLHVFDVNFDTSKPLLRRLDVQEQSTLIVYHGAKETGRMTGATDPIIIKRLLETSVN